MSDLETEIEEVEEDPCPYGEDHSEADCDCCSSCEGPCDVCYSCSECSVDHIECFICGDCSAACECCHECGHEYCTCDEDSASNFGSSRVPPWEHRISNELVATLRDSAPYASESWHKAWPEVNSKLDPVECAGTFYLLEAAMSGLVADVPGYSFTPRYGTDSTKDVEFFELFELRPNEREALVSERDSILRSARDTNPQVQIEYLMGEAKLMLDELVDEILPTFRGYTHMAVAGEARHHRAIGGGVLSTSRDASWSGWRQIFEAVGPDSLMDLSELFLEFDSDSYGGKAWAVPCRLLYQFETGKLGPSEAMNKKMFIDRVWTLEHNGGCFLNKLNWAVTNSSCLSLGDIKSILDAHASDPCNVAKLASVARPNALTLVSNIIKSANQLRETAGLLPISNYANLKFWTRCDYCNSDARIGHTMYCGANESYDYSDGIVWKDKNQTWYSQTTAPYPLADVQETWIKSPNGFVQTNDDGTIDVRLTCFISITNGHPKQIVKNYKLTPYELAGKNFHVLKMFPKGKAPKKEDIVSIRFVLYAGVKGQETCVTETYSYNGNTTVFQQDKKNPIKWASTNYYKGLKHKTLAETTI